MAETDGALSTLLNFISDSQHKLSKRAALVVILLFGLLFVDNYIGFSDYYAYQNKIEQITKIEALLQRSDLDSNMRKQLRAAENQILTRKSWIGQLPSLMSLMTSATSSRAIQANNPSSGKIIVVKQEAVKRNVYWHVGTSTWPLILLIIGFAIVPFAGERIEGGTIAAAILCIGALCVLAYALSILFLQIPILFGRPWLNYLLNSIISLALAFGVTMFFASFRKRSTTY